jgi:hypothetical protein
MGNQQGKIASKPERKQQDFSNEPFPTADQDRTFI